MIAFQSRADISSYDNMQYMQYISSHNAKYHSQLEGLNKKTNKNHHLIGYKVGNKLFREVAISDLSNDNMLDLFYEDIVNGDPIFILKEDKLPDLSRVYCDKDVHCCKFISYALRHKENFDLKDFSYFSLNSSQLESFFDYNGSTLKEASLLHYKDDNHKLNFSYVQTSGAGCLCSFAAILNYVKDMNNIKDNTGNEFFRDIQNILEKHNNQTNGDAQKELRTLIAETMIKFKFSDSQQSMVIQYFVAMEKKINDFDGDEKMMVERILGSIHKLIEGKEEEINTSHGINKDTLNKLIQEIKKQSVAKRKDCEVEIIQKMINITDELKLKVIKNIILDIKSLRETVEGFSSDEYFSLSFGMLEIPGQLPSHLKLIYDSLKDLLLSKQKLFDISLRMISSNLESITMNDPTMIKIVASMMDITCNVFQIENKIENLNVFKLRPSGGHTDKLTDSKHALNVLLSDMHFTYLKRMNE